MEKLYEAINNGEIQLHIGTKYAVINNTVTVQITGAKKCEVHLIDGQDGDVMDQWRFISCGDIEKLTERVLSACKSGRFSYEMNKLSRDY